MTNNIITKANGNNKVIDFRDYLRVAPVEDYSMIHHTGGKGEVKSSIKLMLCDYSKGKGEKSVTVSASLEVELINQLYEVVKNRISTPLSQNKNAATLDALINDLRVAYEKCDEGSKAVVKKVGNITKAIKDEYGVTPGANDYMYVQDRIHVHRKEADGRAPVNKLMITRQPIRSNGQASNYPWFIKITNGKAPVIEKDGGQINYDASKLAIEGEAFINLSDADMFRMMHRIVRYIEVWENANAIPVIKEGLRKREEERVQAANNRS